MHGISWRSVEERNISCLGAAACIAGASVAIVGSTSAVLYSITDYMPATVAVI